MDAHVMVVGLLRKMGGYSEEEVQRLFQAGENRLLDLKAICHGGAMSNGVQVPGMGPLYQAVVGMAGELAEQRKVVAQLVAKLENLQVEELPLPRPVDDGKKSGKKGVGNRSI